jgi:hypothetical protein
VSEGEVHVDDVEICGNAYAVEFNRSIKNSGVSGQIPKLRSYERSAKDVWDSIVPDVSK